MDFKYKVKDNKTWDTNALKRVLIRDYPGAKNAVEAMSMARASLNKKKDFQEIEDAGFEMTLALIEIENYGAGTIEIDKDHEHKLSLMKTETVQQIRLWVKGWKRAIDLAKEKENESCPSNQLDSSWR